MFHSFTEFNETVAPKCGVAGKEVATCDNGCGHKFEKPVDPTPGGSGEPEPDTPDVPDTPDEPTDSACDHICHDALWFIRIFWEIVNLFYRLFGINQVCSCGAAHY